MLTALFYYSLCLLLAFAIAASVCLSAFFVSHRQAFLYAMASFLFYFFDVSLPFSHTFVTPQSTLGAQSYWDVGDPFFSVLFGGGSLLFLWLAACQYVGKDSLAVRFAPAAVFVVASTLIYHLVDPDQWREFLFYSMRSIYVLFCLAVLVLWQQTAEETAIRESLSKHWKVGAAVLVLVLAVVIEDVYLQLLFTPSVMPGDSWFLAERSFAENALFLFFAGTAMAAAQKTLSIHYVAPPERDDAPMYESIGRVLPLYSQRKGLTRRESEVLELIVMGKDNQNIASALQLSPNTVKVHVRNILKKTEQADRHSLIQDFWKS